MKSPLIFGYLECWDTMQNLTFTAAAQKGYTAIIMAFGTISREEVGIFGGQFSPSPTPEALQNDITEAKTQGAQQVLCSFGGEGSHNTYQPNEVDVKLLAQNIVNFLKRYGFTGVDFDLEFTGSEADKLYLKELCLALKSIDPTIIITAAPQLNQADHNTDLFFVSTSAFRLYDPAIEANCLDYILAQAYNNPWPLLNGSQQTDASFIHNAFDNLKKSIPEETMLVIGEPASLMSAGTSIFSNAPDQSTVYEALATEYARIQSDAQFGGIMTWNINQDIQAGGHFITMAQSVV